MSGRIILLNGASSSGKSTLARELQNQLDIPFWHYFINHLIAAQILPKARIKSGEFSRHEMRSPFFECFHRYYVDADVILVQVIRNCMERFLQRARGEYHSPLHSLIFAHSQM